MFVSVYRAFESLLKTRMDAPRNITIRRRKMYTKVNTEFEIVNTANGGLE